MRTLTSTLTAAQKSATRTPVIILQAHNKLCGVERLSFTRLYAGAEYTNAYHGAAISGDGSLVRARLDEYDIIYYQRVANPGPGSDFSLWTNSGLTTSKPLAVTAWGAEVSIFYLNIAASTIRRLKSTDNGATFADELVIALGFAVSGSDWIAAAYSPSGRCVVFYVTGTNATIRWTYWSGGAWQALQSAILGGGWSVVQEIATCGQPDDNTWPLAVAALQPTGDKYLAVSQFNWNTQTIYGAVEVTRTPSASPYSLHWPYLAADAQVRLFFTERYTGVASYERVFHTWQVPGSNWGDNLSAEPEPFDYATAPTYNTGLAPAVATSYFWLCNPSGVWRAPRSVDGADISVDLSADVLRLKASEDPKGGELVAELDNSAGQYASPGTGALAALHVGSELRLAIGYETAAGSETSWANYYRVSELAHVSQGGKASLVVTAQAPGRLLSEWTARHAYRWNAVGFTYGAVMSILRCVFARAGIYLEITTYSSTAAAFYPDFTIYPGERGASVVARLLKLVPDVIRSDLARCELLNPQAADASDYTYACPGPGSGDTTHAILEGEYATLSPQVTRVRAEGRDPALFTPVVADSFDWPGIANVADRLAYVFDTAITTAAQAAERGTAYLRDAAIAALSGEIVVPANAGQELYDVVTITDARAGLSAVKRRVLGLKLTYDARRAIYTHTLTLGGV